MDFVAQNKKGTVYFQVALTVQDENTLLRELRPLQAIRDHYPKIILTMDEEPEEQYEGIRRINARDWLLGIVELRQCKLISTHHLIMEVDFCPVLCILEVPVLQAFRGISHFVWYCKAVSDLS
mgnify:CR=1 FL=1